MIPNLKGLYALCSISLLMLTCACAGLQTDAADKAARIIALDRNPDISRQERIPRELKKADRFVDADFTADKLHAYSPQTLKLLLKGLDTASFYSYGAAHYVSMQEKVFNELADRHLQTPEDIEAIFQKYLSARMFDKAKSLRSKYPDAKLWRIPEIVESNGHGKSYGVYDISDDSRTATVKYLPIDSGPKIVIAALGECPVTARALKSVETDKDLLRVLQSNGMLLTMRFEPEGVAFFNAKTTAATRLYVAYTLEDWPGMDFTMSPTFYFLKDGKILHQFVGWGPDEESLRDFNKGLALIGL